MTHDDLSLMRRLQAGDEQAMSVLLAEHWASVVSYAFRLVGSWDKAEAVARTRSYASGRGGRGGRAAPWELWFTVSPGTVGAVRGALRRGVRIFNIVSIRTEVSAPLAARTRRRPPPNDAGGPLSGRCWSRLSITPGVIRFLRFHSLLITHAAQDRRERVIAFLTGVLVDLVGHRHHRDLTSP